MIQVFGDFAIGSSKSSGGGPISLLQLAQVVAQKPKLGKIRK
jgi:hypothetical protein